MKVIEVFKDVETPVADAATLTTAVQGFAITPPYLGDPVDLGTPTGWHPATELVVTWPYANHDSRYLSVASDIPGTANEPIKGYFEVRALDSTGVVTLLSFLDWKENQITIPGADIEAALLAAGHAANEDIEIQIRVRGYSGLYAPDPQSLTVLFGTI